LWWREPQQNGWLPPPPLLLPFFITSKDRRAAIKLCAVQLWQNFFTAHVVQVKVQRAMGPDEMLFCSFSEEAVSLFAPELARKEMG
jgi:hypothetical protein